MDLGFDNQMTFGLEPEWKQLITYKNILEDSYYLVKHFPDFQAWEYRIAYFK